VSRGPIPLCVIGRGAPASLFTVWDRTFSTNGRVGLWTQEHNVTRFDQFEIAALAWSEDPGCHTA